MILYQGNYERCVDFLLLLKKIFDVQHQLCPPVEVFAALTSCPYFNTPEFDPIAAGGLQCYFIPSVTTAVRI